MKKLATILFALLACAPVIAQQIPEDYSKLGILQNMSLANPGVNATDTSAVEAWGDSFTNPTGAGEASYIPTLISLSGKVVNNNGVAGETSTQIKNRFLASSAEKKARPQIIWAGINNFIDPVTVKADIAAMVSAIGHKNYLVISIINATYSGQESGGGGWKAIVQLNADLAATYGEKFVDMRTFLVNQYNPSNPADVANFLLDQTPSSLRSDPLHFKPVGTALFAQRIYQSFPQLFGRDRLSLTPQAVKRLFYAPPLIGVSVRTPGRFANIDLSGSLNIDKDAAIRQDGINVFRTKYSSTYIGYLAGASALARPTELYNTAIGQYALQSDTTGSENVAVGTSSMQFNASGKTNTAVGINTLMNNVSGNENVAIGQQAFLNNTTGSEGVALGQYALAMNTTGNRNIALGWQAGSGTISGSENIFIGSYAGQLNSTGSNNIIIGVGANAVSGAESNRYVLSKSMFGTNINSLTGASYAIGNEATSLKAVLDLTSTTKGFLTPRMTTAQRDAITSPEEGLEIYNLTTHAKEYYNGTVWKTILTN